MVPTQACHIPEQRRIAIRPKIAYDSAPTGIIGHPIATGDEYLRQTKTSASFVLLFLSMFLLAFAQPSSAQTPYYTLCRYQGQQDNHTVVYVTPIIHWSRSASEISDAFNRFMSANYDIHKIQAGSGYCSTVSNSADQQAYTMQQLEKQWADSKDVVTHVSWTATPDEIAADNAKLAAKAANAPAPHPHVCRPGDRDPVCRKH
jgi:hypothetical protein